MYMHFCKLKIGNKLFPWDYSLKMRVMKNFVLSSENETLLFSSPPFKGEINEKKRF